MSKKKWRKLIQSGHLEKIQNVEEDCFVSLVLLTVKKNKQVKIALDSWKLKDSRKKKRPHLPIMEESLNQVSPKKRGVKDESLSILKCDLECVYSQLKLPEKTSRLFNVAKTGGNMYAFLRI